MKLKRFETLIIVAIIVVVAGAYAVARQSKAPVVQQPQTEQTKSQSSEVKYQGVEGKTAMELLVASRQVELKNYSFGNMVVGIDGVKPDAKHFWGFYVNGSLAQIGADAYVTKATDTIEWKLEEIK